MQGRPAEDGHKVVAYCSDQAHSSGEGWLGDSCCGWFWGGLLRLVGGRFLRLVGGQFLLPRRCRVGEVRVSHTMHGDRQAVRTAEAHWAQHRSCPCVLADQSHPNFCFPTRSRAAVKKATMVAGVHHLRVLPTHAKDGYALQPEALEAAIQADLAAGLIPCYVVATIGTTGSCAVDPVPEVAAVAQRHSLWCACWHQGQRVALRRRAVSASQHMPACMMSAHCPLFFPPPICHVAVLLNLSSAATVQDPCGCGLGRHQRPAARDAALLRGAGSGGLATRAALWCDA